MNRSRRSALGALAALIFCGLLVACEGKINDDNYDRIQTGMSYSAVTDILGSGEEQTATGTSISGSGMLGGSSGAPKLETQRTYLWRDRNREINITFIDDKVAVKSKLGF
jgi:hypothetical protein